MERDERLAASVNHLTDTSDADWSPTHCYGDATRRPARAGDPKRTPKVPSKYEGRLGQAGAGGEASLRYYVVQAGCR